MKITDCPDHRRRGTQTLLGHDRDCVASGGNGGMHSGLDQCGSDV
jgi:hypothetical protein